MEGWSFSKYRSVLWLFLKYHEVNREHSLGGEVIFYVSFGF